jgi:hypothetical protein
MAVDLYNGPLYDEALYNDTGSTIGISVPGEVESVLSHEVYKYRLELRDSSGTLLSYLKDWHDGRWTEKVNEPDTLEFAYPSDGPGAGSFAWSSQVWMRDQFGNVKQKFRILRPAAERSEDGGLTSTVTAESLLGQLAEEFLASYEATDAAPKTRAQILEEWLRTYQSNALPLKFGAVDPLIGDATVAIAVDAKTLLSAIYDLMATYSGESFLWVNPRSRAVYWRVNRGSTGKTLRYRKNLSGVRREIGDDFFTRLYCYGWGTGPNRLTLRDAGQPNEYLDADTVSTYGVRIQSIVESKITDPDTLLLYAQAALAKNKVPPVTYAGNIVDLAQLGDQWKPHTIEIGSLVSVLDEDFKPTAMQVSTRVLEIARNLDDPLDVQVVLNRKKRTLADLLAEILAEIGDLQTADPVTPAISLDPAEAMDAGLSDGDPYDPKPMGVPSDRGRTGMVSDAGHIHGTEGIVPDAAPQDVVGTAGTPQTGDSGRFADQDHGHKLAAGATVALSTNTPQAVVATGAGAPGSGTAASKDDHKHPRYIYGARAYLGNDIAGLTVDSAEAVARGDFAVTQEPRVYARMKLGTGDAWVPIARQIVVANWAARPTAGLVEGDEMLCLDLKNYYRYRNSQWRIDTKFEGSSAPSSIGEAEGDVWEDTGNKKRMVYRTSAWVNLEVYD